MFDKDAQIEAGAAFILGLYIAFGVNYDGKNLSVILSVGMLIITNVAASLSGYFAYYPNKKMLVVSKDGVYLLGLQ